MHCRRADARCGLRLRRAITASLPNDFSRLCLHERQFELLVDATRRTSETTSHTATLSDSTQTHTHIAGVYARRVTARRAEVWEGEVGDNCDSRAPRTHSRSHFAFSRTHFTLSHCLRRETPSEKPWHAFLMAQKHGCRLTAVCWVSRVRGWRLERTKRLRFLLI